LRSQVKFISKENWYQFIVAAHNCTLGRKKSMLGRKEIIQITKRETLWQILAK